MLADSPEAFGRCLHSFAWHFAWNVVTYRNPIGPHESIYRMTVRVKARLQVKWITVEWDGAYRVYVSVVLGSCVRGARMGDAPLVTVASRRRPLTPSPINREYALAFAAAAAAAPSNQLMSAITPACGEHALSFCLMVFTVQWSILISCLLQPKRYSPLHSYHQLEAQCRRMSIHHQSVLPGRILLSGMKVSHLCGIEWRSRVNTFNLSTVSGPSVQSVVVPAGELSPLLGSGSNSNDSTANRQLI